MQLSLTVTLAWYLNKAAAKHYAIRYTDCQAATGTLPNVRWDVIDKELVWKFMNACARLCKGLLSRLRGKDGEDDEVDYYNSLATEAKLVLNIYVKLLRIHRASTRFNFVYWLLL
ncbi:hypothetical protein BDQ17DRAFT_1338541, partial [Cyathus striatus]